MMILAKEIKIKKTKDLTTGYIESQLKEFGTNIISWAIVEVDDDNYTLNVAIEE